MATRLTKVFRELRKQGLIARQNFLCCGNCAGSQIACDITEMIDKGKDRASIKGCVFYHQQDAERFREGYDLWLAFGNVDTEKYGKVGLSTVAVGYMVCAELAKAGIRYEWDGNESKRISVKAEDAAALAA